MALKQWEFDVGTRYAEEGFFNSQVGYRETL